MTEQVQGGFSPRLGEIFSFTPADLIANRAGQLSESQLQRRKKRVYYYESSTWRSFWTFVVVSIFGLLLILVGNNLAKNGKGLEPIELFFLGVTALLLIIPFLINSSASTNANTTGLPPVEGDSLSISWEERPVPYNDRIRMRRLYYLHVGNQQLTIQDRAYEDLLNTPFERPPNHRYRVYYLKDARWEQVISIELIPIVDVG